MLCKDWVPTIKRKYTHKWSLAEFNFMQNHKKNLSGACNKGYIVTIKFM